MYIAGLFANTSATNGIGRTACIGACLAPLTCEAFRRCIRMPAPEPRLPWPDRPKPLAGGRNYLRSTGWGAA